MEFGGEVAARSATGFSDGNDTMPIELRCPGCSQQLRVPDDAAGKTAKCPKCAALVQIPGAAAPPPPPPPSTPEWSFGAEAAKPAASPFGAAGNPYSTEPGKGYDSGPVNPYASPQTLPDKPLAGFPPTGTLGHQVVSIEDVLNYALKVWQANLGLLVGVTFTVIAINSVLNAILSGIQGVIEQQGEMELAIAVVIIGNLVLNVIQMFLGIGQAQICLKLARRQPAQFSDLFNGGSRFLPVLGGSILAGVALIVGFALCFVPGVILLLYFWPFYYLVVDEKARVLDSFTMAGRITEGNRLTTFLIWLLSVGISLLGVLALCVGLLFALPLISLLWATAYLMMSAQLPTQPELYAKPTA